MQIKGITLASHTIPKVCVAIVAKTRGAFIRDWNETKINKVDVIEWRVDYYEEDHQEIFDLLKEENRPVIFTIRTKEEGGNMPYNKKRYLELYKQAIDSNVIDLIDLEWARNHTVKEELLRDAKKNGVKIITSYHDFDRTPNLKEGKQLLKDLANDEGDVVKIAVMPQSKKDVLALLQLSIEAQTLISQPIITMAMGELGAISRIIGEWSGSVLTFGTIKQASAPGQIDVECLSEALRTNHDCMTRSSRNEV